MLTAANVWYQAAPQYLLLPAGALLVTVLALTVLGDGVRTALDPRAASRLRVGTGRKREAKAAADSKKAAADASAEKAAADASTNKEAKA
jgi:peptide/nickel transport system permease protein